MDLSAHSVARLLAALFSGACVYIALVEHPARLRMPTLSAIEQFRTSITRAERVQPALLIAALVALGLAQALQPLPVRTLVGGGLLALIVPWSFVLLVPINRRLQAGPVADHRVSGLPLLRRWGHLHGLRAAIAVLGTAFL